MLRFLLSAALIVIALSCSGDALGPLIKGQAYTLTDINGKALPQAVPNETGPVTGGWIRLDSDSLGERHEQVGNATQSSWTATGRATVQGGLVILDYRAVAPNGRGARNPVDTFYVSNGGLVLRERGYGPPVDSLVRFYRHP